MVVQRSCKPTKFVMMGDANAFGSGLTGGTVTRHVEVKVRMSQSYALYLRGLRLDATDSDYVFLMGLRYIFARF